MRDQYRDPYAVMSPRAYHDLHTDVPDSIMCDVRCPVCGWDPDVERALREDTRDE